LDAVARAAQDHGLEAVIVAQVHVHG
jgi:hypothetical protein